MSGSTLTIKRFGPIRKVSVPFGDITVLVGPQATGKSLVLQWFKLIRDRHRIAFTLSQHGYEIDRDPKRLLSLFFGANYRDAWKPASAASLNGKDVGAHRVAESLRRREGSDSVLYIPAHRAIVLGTGYPLIFRAFRADTPFVVRAFSEKLGQYLGESDAEAVFPIQGRYRQEVRRALDEALFHSGKVVVSTAPDGERSLQLVHGHQKLSVMEWTTGQREALPLIAGLYDALPSGKLEKRPGLEWVIAEEPELGLHPNAVIALMVLLLEVVRRGYRLVISTHSSLVVDLLWAIQQLKTNKDAERRVAKILGLRTNNFSNRLAVAALNSRLRIVYFDFKGGKVDSKEITSLDPFSDDPEISGWGGLTEHNTRISDVVAGEL